MLNLTQKKDNLVIYCFHLSVTKCIKVSQHWVGISREISDFLEVILIDSTSSGGQRIITTQTQRFSLNTFGPKGIFRIMHTSTFIIALFLLVGLETIFVCQSRDSGLNKLRNAAIP